MARNYISARPINGILSKIMEPVLKKRGFPSVALVADWPVIVGEQLAACSAPEKVSWPRRTQNFGEPDAAQTGSDPSGRASAAQHGATLRLRVDPVMALDVEYRKAQILDRINRYFGYRAVTRLTIVQGPVTAPQTAGPKPRKRRLQPAIKDLDLSGIEDGALRQALARLNESRQK